MSKMTRLVKGELNKMLFQPLIYVLVGALIVSLLISLFTFNPKNKSDDYNFYNQFYENNKEIVQVFNTTNESYGKISCDSIVDDVKNELNYYKQIVTQTTQPNALTNIKTYMAGIKNLYDQGLKANLSGGESNFNTTKAGACANAINSLKQSFFNMRLDYEQAINKDMPIALINSASDKTVSELIDFAIQVLSTNQEGAAYTYSETTSYDGFLHVVNEFDVKILIAKLEKQLNTIQDVTERFTIENISDIEILVNKADAYRENLNQTIQDSPNSVDKTKLEVIDCCKRYYLVTQQIKNYAQTSLFAIALTGVNKSAISQYKNFEDITYYEIQEQHLINAYLLSQSPVLTPLDYASGFSNQVSSENTVDAFDFMFYALNIALLFIIVFCLIYGAKMISYEVETLTLKNLVTKPFSRNKIISSKILSTICFGVICFLICALMTFFIGLVLFGSSFTSIIFVVNASTVVEMSPLLYMLIFVLLSCLKIVLFSVLAVMVSTFFKNGRLAAIVAVGIYALTLICVLSPVNSAIMGVLSPLNFDLFKYFGSTLTNAFVVSTPMLTYGNLVISVIYTLLVTTIFAAVAHLWFNKKEIN